MDIYINGQRLDLDGSGVSLHFSSLRFSESIQDEYSTDIDIPLTASNIALLGVWGMLDRAQLFGKKVRCDVVMDSAQQRGYLHVTEVDEMKVTASLYVERVPGGMWEGDITAGITDSGATIFKYERNNSIHAQTPPNPSVLPYTNGGGPMHPQLRVNTILSNIADAYGVTIPSVDALLCVVASERTICPKNTTQCVQWEIAADDTVKVKHAGQHVCDTLSESNYFLLVNRDCHAEITIGVRCYSGNGSSVQMNVKRGVTEYPLGSAITAALGSDAVGTFSSSAVGGLLDGDELILIVGGGSASVAVGRIEFSDYAVTSDDYGKDMDFIPVGVGFPSVFGLDDVASGGDADTVLGATGCCYQYIGTYCNIPSVSVRDFLTSLCWHLGKRAVYANDAVSFVNSTETREVDARIVSMSPIYEGLGRITRVAWSGGRDGVSVAFANDFLEEDKEIHKSVFYGVGDGGSIPQYDGDTFSKIDGIPLAKMVGGALNMKVLTKVDQLTALGVDDLTRVMLVEAETYDDVSGLDYAIVEGHKYMIVDGDRDVDTGLTTFRGLLI